MMLQAHTKTQHKLFVIIAVIRYVSFHAAVHLRNLRLLYKRKKSIDHHKID